MSEFSNTQEKRLIKLKEVSLLILQTGNAQSFIQANADFISTVIPEDFILLFDQLVTEGHSISDLKALSNKLLNIFHLSIRDYPRLEPAKDSFLGLMEANNQAMHHLLNQIRPVYKDFLKDQNANRERLFELFQELRKFTLHYTLKENVLFPVLEARWQAARCLEIMWSFHDTIRQNLKFILELLQSGDTDMTRINRVVADLFFNMLAIKFREEAILHPAILSSLSDDDHQFMLAEGIALGFPFVHPSTKTESKTQIQPETAGVDLKTGTLSPEQITLIFNHLPVDITFVDEHNRVQYFSTPARRIFPRTIAVLGREVSKCHPPESVHVVEKIVDSFRNGLQSQADFWIKMKGDLILIQYFAVRDSNGSYRGVIEVSQEITHIQSIEGEKRLLEW